MMIKLTLLYGRPEDPAAFEEYYSNTHLPIAAKIKGIERAEFSKVVGTPDGSEPTHYRIADLYFNDLPHMQTVMSTPEAQAAVNDLPNFATGGVTKMISQIS